MKNLFKVMLIVAMAAMVSCGGNTSKKYQISARTLAVGGTNAVVIQQAKDGIKTISLGIPCRYMHTPVELCDLDDIKAAIDLVYHIVTH